MQTTPCQSPDSSQTAASDTHPLRPQPSLEENKAAPPFLPESSRAGPAAEWCIFCISKYLTGGAALVDVQGEFVTRICLESQRYGAAHGASFCQPWFHVQGTGNSLQPVCKILFAPLVQISLETAICQI